MEENVRGEPRLRAEGEELSKSTPSMRSVAATTMYPKGERK